MQAPADAGRCVKVDGSGKLSGTDRSTVVASHWSAHPYIFRSARDHALVKIVSNAKFALIEAGRRMKRVMSAQRLPVYVIAVVYVIAMTTLNFALPLNMRA